MKKCTILLASLLCGFVVLLNAQPVNNAMKSGQQIEFSGLVSQNEGMAGWYADGTGDEPAGIGHMVPGAGFTNLYYYGASRDYITGDTSQAGCHFHSVMTGFPFFEAALVANNFTPDQVKIRYGLTSAKEDIEGEDWLNIGVIHHATFYDCCFSIDLNGEQIFTGFFNYTHTKVDTTGGDFFFETSFSPLTLNPAISDTAVLNVAQAFYADLGGAEVKLSYGSSPGTFFSGNGRTGAYYNILNGVLELGHPSLPFTGMVADNEGFAGWDADGSGTEPLADGHGSQMYYGASVDYNDIDPDSTAALGHCTTGATGFINTLLQLEYRGYSASDLKLKMGLISLGPDVHNEDWGEELNSGWCNYYKNKISIELSGEPILNFMCDTNKLVSHYSDGDWSSTSHSARVYNICDAASVDAYSVAKAFIKDLGNHYLSFNASKITYASGSSFTGNGRTGAIWNINQGALVANSRKATFVSSGEVNGTWDLDGSPYFIDGHVIIPDSQTLLIEPGVMVGVRGPWRFNVKGSVEALGTDSSKILFTRSNPRVMWDGFDMQEIATTNDSSKFDYCIFEHGYAFGGSISPNGNALNSGGAFALKFVDKLKITNSVFRYNSSQKQGYYPPSGGAIALWNSDPFIQKCVFYENDAEYGGAIMSYKHSNPVVSNCLFHNNYADKGGAICPFEHGHGIFINNTFVANSAGLGGAFYFHDDSNPELINNLIWGNTAGNEGPQLYFTTSTSKPKIYYCDVEGGENAFGGAAFSGEYFFNIDMDPFFAQDFHHPYRIDGSSPCVGAGSPDSSTVYYENYLPELCLCGSPRIYDGIDIGAYEFDPSYTTIMQEQYNNTPIMAYPNPFSDKVKIAFELSKKAQVSLRVFDCLGKMVEGLENTTMAPGKYESNWNSQDHPAGLYFIQLQKGEKVLAQRIVKQ